MQFFIQTLWFLLPAGIANMAPVLVNKINFLNYPVDNGRSFGGKRLFGDHKTWRGLFFGPVFSIFTIAVQKILFSRSFIVRSISFLDYTDENIYLVGFLLGVGALFGDLIKSFLKRRINIAPGKPWVPLDQLDWIVGSLWLVSLVVNLTWQIWVVALFSYGLLHPAINIIGYWLKIKPNRF